MLEFSSVCYLHCPGTILILLLRPEGCRDGSSVGDGLVLHGK